MSVRVINIPHELKQVRKCLASGKAPCSACRGVLMACGIDALLDGERHARQIKRVRRVGTLNPAVEWLQWLYRLEDPRQ